MLKVRSRWSHGKKSRKKVTGNKVTGNKVTGKKSQLYVKDQKKINISVDLHKYSRT